MKVTTFESHGYKYIVDDCGIHQLEPQPFAYDANYVGIYDTPSYVKGNNALQILRMAFVIKSLGRVPKSIQDNGYGNGAFMKQAKSICETVYGKDVTGIQIEGCEIVEENKPAEVYTFWDCLEHIHDLSFIKDLPCEIVCVSLPNCHGNEQWFSNDYKHRKPNEHLHHFNYYTLSNLFKTYGWVDTKMNYDESIVRANGDKSNILTVSFKRL